MRTSEDTVTISTTLTCKYAGSDYLASDGRLIEGWMVRDLWEPGWEPLKIRATFSTHSFYGAEEVSIWAGIMTIPKGSKFGQRIAKLDYKLWMWLSRWGSSGTIWFSLEEDLG